MLCEKCGINTATTHIRTVVNGVVHEKHLCGQCAASEGNYDINNQNLNQMLSNIFDGISKASQNKIVHCSCCGSTFQDIVNSGKCGCSECYITFYEQLLPHLKKVQGSIEYVGKKIDKDVKKDLGLIEMLNAKLEKLIEEENYEQAAVVRDEIKKLQEGV